MKEEDSENGESYDDENVGTFAVGMARSNGAGGSEPSGEMALLDHLEDLRWTLARCVGAFMLSCILIGIFVFQFADLLRWPYEFAVSSSEGANNQLYVRGFMGSFSVMFQLFFMGGFILSLPAILFFLGRFIAPGLTPAERRVLLPGSIAATGLFLLGASFSFFILLPAGLKASVMLSQMFGYELLIDAPSYYGLLLWATMGVGTSFEFPLIMLILMHVGMLTTLTLSKYRRHAIVGFLVVSAVVTPTPDPLTFLFLAIPLWILYELAIFVGRWVEKKRAGRILEADLEEL